MHKNQEEGQISFKIIAKRQPPGDRWKLVDESSNPVGSTIDGLVETLAVYMRSTGHKGGYRLEPLKGYLMAIEWLEAPPPPPPKVYDLYGEG